ncbi:MAG TPA: SIR2 family protein [Kofleriaceae bacterium]|nr:SIR2 family protein [Kofleriaceae bacterium]
MKLEDAKARILELVPRNTILFVGAGMSMDLGFPGWNKLVEQFATAIEADSPECAVLMRGRLQRNRVIEAADPAYLEEVRPETRVRFLEKTFGTTPEIKRRHKLMGQLPVAAFVTLNFDSVLEAAIGNSDLGTRQRMAQVFNGPTRFTRFNSAFSMYLEQYSEISKKKALLLKIHNDMTDPENIVLSSTHMRALGSEPGYRAFYETCFRSSNVVFLGFGGNDPNFLEILAREVNNYAGFSARNSYLIVPAGTTIPPALASHPQVVPVHYDTRDNHQQIEELLKELGDRWNEQPREDTNLAVALAEQPIVSIFELMTPALRAGVDSTIIEQLGRFMVATGKHLARSNTDRNSIANRVSQRYGIPITQAKALVDAYQGEPAAATLSGGQDPAPTLAEGLYTRALAYDARLQIKAADIIPIVKAVLQHSLSAFGGNVALTVLHLETPSPSLFKQEVDKQIRKPWPKVGDVEREALALAFSDMFQNPQPAEEEIISRLSLTAVAFGLIQALPEASLATDVVPDVIYIDSNIALPLLTRMPRKDATIRNLLKTAQAQRRMVLMHEGFLSEIEAHYELAFRRLSEQRLVTVDDVTRYLQSLAEPDEFVNVFLLMIQQVQAAPTDRAEQVLRKHFGDGRQVTFARQLRLSGIDITDVIGPAERENDLRHYILTNKQETYNRSLRVREILARNEARQLTVMEIDRATQRRSWFITDDNQLRALARRAEGLADLTLLSLLSSHALLTAVTVGAQIGNAFAKMLWSPDWHDRADLVVAEAIQRLLPALDSKVRIPIEEARRYAVAELEKRHAAEQDDDNLVGTPPAPQESVVESVYHFIGKRIQAQKGSKS